MNDSSSRPMRILCIVDTEWDPRLGAPRVWIELGKEWAATGNVVEKFCLTDAFPTPAKSSAVAALRRAFFPFRAAAFVRRNANRFDVIDCLIGTLPFSKRSLRFKGLLVARSVGLFQLYEKFEQMALRRWGPAAGGGRLVGRIFYGILRRRGLAASRKSVEECDLLNLPNADELVCVREDLKSSVAAIVEPYGLADASHAAFVSASRTPSARLSTKKVCFVGMWSPRKGAKDWGEIIRQIRTSVPGTSFLLVGTMIENQKVMSDLGSLDGVALVPQYQPADLPRLLADSTVAGFPSYVEGFGLAVLEQLAAGIPVVAYDAAGPRDILGSAMPEMLIEPGNTAQFSQSIIAILQFPLSDYETLSNRARTLAATFSWPVIARRTIAAYQERLSSIRGPDEQP